MARNIFNIEEIEEQIKRVVTDHLVSFNTLPSAASEAIHAWANSTFRNYVVRDYRISQWCYAPGAEEIISSFIELLPDALIAATEEVYDAEDEPRRALVQQLGSRTSALNRMSRIGTVLIPTLKDLLVPMVVQPSWVGTNSMYGMVDVSTIGDELRDLLDVMASDWFEQLIPSLGRMSVADVESKHESWIKWGRAKIAEAEDFDGLRKMEAGLPSPFSLVELTTSANLRREGTKLRHCVAANSKKYLAGIHGGTRRMFSLRTTDNEPVLTIELDTENNIVVQIRGKCNRLPTMEEIALLRQFFLGLGSLLNVSIAKSSALPNPRRLRAVEEEEDAEEDDDEDDEEDADEDEGEIRQQARPRKARAGARQLAVAEED